MSAEKRKFTRPHPGKILKSLYMEPLELSVTELAKTLHIDRPGLSLIINGHRGISADMAYRLAMAFGTSPNLWMNMQSNYELWLSKSTKRPKVKKIPMAI